MRQIRNTSTNHTLQGDHAKSLFKFVIKCINGVTLYQFSYDFPEERAKFFSGLSVANRETWIGFMHKLPAEAYAFYANTYPEFITASKVVLHYTNEPEMIEMSKFIKQDNALSGLIKEARLYYGFEFTAFKAHELNDKLRPDITPKFHDDVGKFNGLVNVKNYYLRKFAHSSKEIIIYDNLAYHSDNEVLRLGKNELDAFLAGKVAQVPFTEPTPPVKRSTSGESTLSSAIDKTLNQIPSYREQFEINLKKVREAKELLKSLSEK